MSKKTIVITGCSSGFGRVTALHLAARGWRVFGTVRKEADQADLLAEAATRGCKENLTPILCDITDAQQVKTLAETVAQFTPQLDALLNNAGTAYASPLELLPLDDLRAQLELSVVAQVAVTQALLPLLKVHRGTIIFVSSVSGRIASPMLAAYSAGKFAIEAISDALRLEMDPFGIHVVLIEPGSSPTSIWTTSMQRSLSRLETHRNGPYARLLGTYEKMAQTSSRSGFPQQLFADTVEKILNNPHPRARYPLPASAVRDIFLRRILPDQLWDGMLRRVLHLK